MASKHSSYTNHLRHTVLINDYVLCQQYLCALSLLYYQHILSLIITGYKCHDFVYYINQNPVLRSEKDWHKNTALTLAIKLIKKE